MSTARYPPASAPYRFWTSSATRIAGIRLRRFTSDVFPGGTPRIPVRSGGYTAVEMTAEPLDPSGAAKSVGLRYVSDAVPGISRRRTRRGFAYRDEHGRPIRSRDELRRIAALAVPPA